MINGQRSAGAVALAIPVVLANVAAVYGQSGWAWTHLITEPMRAAYFAASLALSIIFALTIESIGVYLSVMAHLALMADQSAGLLRLGSYAIGCLAGALNYWHFAGPGFAPNAVAVTFAVFSAISPWLWAVYSRYLNRVRLAELGMVDKRLVKLSTARKLLHPIRSFKVISWAAWAGVTEPDAAVAGWERATGRTPAVGVAAVPAPVPMFLAPYASQRPLQGTDGGLSPSWAPPLTDAPRIHLPEPERRTRPEVEPTSGARVNGNGSKPDEVTLQRARNHLADATTRRVIDEAIAAPGTSRDTVRRQLGINTKLADAIMWAIRNDDPMQQQQQQQQQRTEVSA